MLVHFFSKITNFIITEVVNCDWCLIKWCQSESKIDLNIISHLNIYEICGLFCCINKSCPQMVLSAVCTDFRILSYNILFISLPTNVKVDIVYYY